mgnify:CR=1 FL=1
MTTKALPLHPFASLFPDITGKDFDELVASIKRNGLREAISEYNSEVVDGKNRQEACLQAGVTPVYQVWAPTNPAGVPDEILAELKEFILDKNERRRHMTDSVRAMTAAKLSNLKAGTNRHSKGEVATATSISDAAQRMHVSKRYTQMAVAVLKQGDESLVKAVESGEVNVLDASKIVGLSKQKQAEAVTAVKQGKAKKVSAAAGIKPRKKQPKPQPDFNDGADLEAQKQSSKTKPAAPVAVAAPSPPVTVAPAPAAATSSQPEQQSVTDAAIPLNGSFSPAQEMAWRSAFGTIVRMSDDWKKQNSKTKIKTERTHSEFHAIAHALLKKWGEMNPAGRWS